MGSLCYQTKKNGGKMTKQIWVNLLPENKIPYEEYKKELEEKLGEISDNRVVNIILKTYFRGMDREQIKDLEKSITE
jgi:hypothetical protein